MSSLTAFDRLPQLRMIPVSGTPLFRYERRLSNRWVPCNHSRAVSIVGGYNRRAKRLCANLTEGSKTTAECQSVLSAGSQKHSALSICVMATRTNASAHLSISGKSSGRYGMRVNQIGYSNTENLTYKGIDLQFDSLFIFFKSFFKGVQFLCKGKVFILKTILSKKLGCLYCILKIRIVIVNDAFVISSNDRCSMSTHISDICCDTGTVNLNIPVLFTHGDLIINTFFAAPCRNFISHNIIPCFCSNVVVNTHPLNIIDQLLFWVYTGSAAAKSVAGIGVLENIRAHNRAYAVFLCVKHGHIRIMVGRVGAEQSAPGSRMTGYANPARLTTLEIGVSGGEFKHLSFEAVFMTTIPAIAQPAIAVINGQAVTSSLAVADYFRKPHKDVLAKIYRLDRSAEFTERNFSPSEYTDATGRKLPCYQITRDGFAFLAMGFTGKRAAQFKESYITAFNRMEKSLTWQVDTSCAAHNAHVVYLYMSEIHRVWLEQLYPMLVSAQSPLASSLYDYINDGVFVAGLVDSELNEKHKEVRK